MNRENQLLITNELVEVQDFRKITCHLHTVRGIWRICLELMKEKPKDVSVQLVGTWKQLGSRPVVAEKSPQTLELVHL